MRRNPLPWLGSVGGVLAVLVPSGACPVCAAASAAVLSSLGLSAAAASTASRWLVPLFLVGGLVSLWSGARRHGAWWIPALAALGAVLLYAGWWAHRDVAVVAGVATVFLASVLNFHRQRRRSAPLVQLGMKGVDP